MSKSLIWKLPNTENRLFLTFDDGPIPHLTMEILKILSDFEVKASFFCVGENIQKHPELYERIIADGHEIGNHSYNHLSGWKTPVPLYVENVEKAAAVIPSKLFRPPYGQIKYDQIKLLKSQYQIIMWSILSGDFDPKLSPEECLFNVLQSKSGDIVVFHDNIKAKEKVLFALPRFLDHFLKKGFQFTRLSEQLKSIKND